MSIPFATMEQKFLVFVYVGVWVVQGGVPGVGDVGVVSYAEAFAARPRIGLQALGWRWMTLVTMAVAPLPAGRMVKRLGPSLL